MNNMNALDENEYDTIIDIFVTCGTDLMSESLYSRLSSLSENFNKNNPTTKPVDE